MGLLRPARARARILAAAGLLAAACGGEDEDYDPEGPWTEGVIGVWREGLTVEQAGGCSTAIVAGLARQLIDEINCLRPNTLVDFSRGDIRQGAAVWPFIQAPAVRGLHAAIDQRGRAMTVNSALRTLPQQYLLYRWYQNGQCNISLAARPGRSPHESGKAVDIEDNAGWRPAMENHGWDWYGAGDAVHFDYVGGGTVDLSGLSVRAFQRLWNRNHPNDQIAEDGDYGPQTEARLRQSPTDGFPVGGCEPEPPPPPPPPPEPDAAPPPPPPPPADMATEAPDMPVKDALVPDASQSSGDVFVPPVESDSSVETPPAPAFDAGPPPADADLGPDPLPSAPPQHQQGIRAIKSVQYEGGCQSAPGPASLALLPLLALLRPRRSRRRRPRR